MNTACRNRFQQIILALCVSIFAGAPLGAVAETCSDLEGQRSHISTEMLHLVANYPGTHAMLGGCAAAASDEYQRTKDSNGSTGVFFLCVAVGCAIVGVDNCSAISKQWFVLYGQNQQLTSRIRTLDCPA